MRILVGILLGAMMVSCAAPPPVQPRPDRITILTIQLNDLWTQIRDWRHEAGMPVEPPVTLQRQFPPGISVSASRFKCTKLQPEPPTCSDTCVLANAICDNAELICQIADELGKNDPSQEKCTSAKASCREAEERCCDCHANPPAAAEILLPAPIASEAAP